MPITHMISYTFLFLVLYYCYLLYTDKYIRTEEVLSTDWSDNWTNLDFKARENRDCRPIKKVYETWGPIESWIYTVPSSCENGLPHTRNHNVIAIPNNLSFIEIPRIIRHEKIHLNQRLYPNQWKEFYKTYWNYQIFIKPPDKMPIELITMKRANPDTNDAPFACWNNKWWSVPVYKNNDNLEFKNCILKWWNEETNEIQLNHPKEWISFFGSLGSIFSDISEMEHPHEISALYLENKKSSTYSIYDYLINMFINTFDNKNTIDSNVNAKKILFNKWNDKTERLN